MGTSGATMAVINNGTAATKLIVREGTASDTTGLGATTAAQLVASESEATGLAARLHLACGRALKLDALSAGGNIDISTTGASALTVSGAISTANQRSEEHTSELQSRLHLVCSLLLETKTTGSSLVADTAAADVATSGSITLDAT